MNKDLEAEIKRMQEMFDALGYPIPPLPGKHHFETDKAYQIRLKMWARSMNKELYKRLNKSSNGSLEDESKEEIPEKARFIAEEIDKASEELEAFKLKYAFPPERQYPPINEPQTLFSEPYKPTFAERVKNLLGYAKYGLLSLLGIIVMICFFVGVADVFSALRSCSNRGAESKPTGLYDTKTGNAEDASAINAPITEGPDSYVCTGPSATRFHKRRNCFGLNSCTETVMRISAYEACRQGYTPCQRCYNRIERQQLEREIDEWEQSRTDE